MEGINREYLARHRARFRTQRQEGQELGLGQKVALKAGAFMELEEDEWGPVSQIERPARPDEIELAAFPHAPTVIEFSPRE